MARLLLSHHTDAVLAAPPAGTWRVDPLEIAKEGNPLYASNSVRRFNPLDDGH